MRKLILALVTILILAGCQQPTIPTLVNATHKVVKNSLWQDVTPTIAKSLGRSLARELTGADLEAYVDEYNATTLDDYLRLYDSDAVPAVDESPTVSVFICNPVTNAVNWSAEGIERQSLIDNATAWRIDAHGQTLYIDHSPPVVVPPPPANPYEHYAIYEVDNLGQPQFETHCGFLADGSFDGQWIYDGGWSGPDQYFAQMVSALTSDVSTHPGWQLIIRQLYTAP